MTGYSQYSPTPGKNQAGIIPQNSYVKHGKLRYYLPKKSEAEMLSGREVDSERSYYFTNRDINHIAGDVRVRNHFDQPDGLPPVVPSIERSNERWVNRRDD